MWVECNWYAVWGVIWLMIWSLEAQYPHLSTNYPQISGSDFIRFWLLTIKRQICTSFWGAFIILNQIVAQIVDINSAQSCYFASGIFKQVCNHRVLHLLAMREVAFLIPFRTRTQAIFACESFLNSTSKCNFCPFSLRQLKALSIGWACNSFRRDFTVNLGGRVDLELTRWQFHYCEYPQAQIVFYSFCTVAYCRHLPL